MGWRNLAPVVDVVVIAAAGAAFSRFDIPTDEPYVAYVAIDGIILRDDERLDAIGDVADDTEARALVVGIDSPGGAFVASEELYGALRHVAAEKPVVAVIADTGA